MGVLQAYGAGLHKVITGGALRTEMNRTAGMHLLGRIGKRVIDVKHGVTEQIPTCVLRLIEDCCKLQPVERLDDMRAVINRIDLTQTILEHQLASQRRQQGSDPRPAGN